MEWGINQELEGTLQNLQTPSQQKAAQGSRSGVRGCMSPPSGQLMARGQGRGGWTGENLASHRSAPGGGISKKTVEKRRDVTGEALGAALLPWPPAGTLLDLLATASGSAHG